MNFPNDDERFFFLQTWQYAASQKIFAVFLKITIICIGKAVILHRERREAHSLCHRPQGEWRAHLPHFRSELGTTGLAPCDCRLRQNYTELTVSAVNPRVKTDFVQGYFRFFFLILHFLTTQATNGKATSRIPK